MFEQPEIEKTVVRRRTLCGNNTTKNTEETEHEIMHPVSCHVTGYCFYKCKVSRFIRSSEYFLFVASEGRLSFMKLINQRNTVVNKMLSWLAAQKLST